MYELLQDIDVISLELVAVAVDLILTQSMDMDLTVHKMYDKMM